MTYYAIREIPAKKPAEGVELRAVHGERMTVAFFTIAQGSGVPQHAHPHEQIGAVLKAGWSSRLPVKNTSSLREAPTISLPTPSTRASASKARPKSLKCSRRCARTGA